MKKDYIVPAYTVYDMKLENSIMETSGYLDQGDVGAPGMVSFDDMDEDYMDEDNI